MDDELGGFNPMEADYNSTFNSYNYQGSGREKRDENYVQRLHVSRVPMHLNDDTFKELFSKCGEVAQSNLYFKSNTTYKIGRIIFKSKAANRKAIEMYHCQEPYQMTVLLDKYDKSWESRNAPRSESVNDMSAARRAPDQPNSCTSYQLNGQRPNQPSTSRSRQEADRQSNGGCRSCVRCSAKATNKCRKCDVFYCSTECQREDWGKHREICGSDALKNVNSHETTAPPKYYNSDNRRNQRDSSETRGYNRQRNDNVGRHRNPARGERPVRNRSRSQSANMSTRFSDARPFDSSNEKKFDSSNEKKFDSSNEKKFDSSNEKKFDSSNEKKFDSSNEKKFEDKQSNDLNNLNTAERKQTATRNSSNTAKQARNIPDQAVPPIQVKSELEIHSKERSVVDPGEVKAADLFTEVTVTYIETPHNFYVRPSTEDLMSSVLEKMWNEQTVDTNVKLNDLVAAKYREDNQWYRAKVLSINSDGSCRVYFIDYGNIGPIVLDEIFLLPPDLAKIPEKALRCYLANVEPTNGIKWTKEEVEAFQDLVANEVLSLKKVKCVNDLNWVCLANDSKKDIGQLMVCNDNAKLCLPIKSRTMDNWKCGSDILTYVTVADSPGLYEVMDLSSGIIDHLKSLSDVCNQIGSNELDQLTVGAIVAAKESYGDRMWHRAVVVEILPDGYLVQYLDFGNCEKVTELKLLPEEFKMFPAAAVLLADVSRACEDDKFAMEDELKLKAVQCEGDIMCVRLNDDKGHVYAATSVWLEITRRLEKNASKNSGRQADCSRVSIPDQNSSSRNAAECNSISTSSETLAGRSKAGSMREAASDVSTAESTLKAMTIKVETVESNLKDSTHKRPPVKPDFQLPGVKFPGPNETVPVVPVVCTVEEIYVQISTPDNVEIANAISETLSGDCENVGKCLVEIPSISQLLCAKSDDDDQWYRCEVLCVNSPDSIEVRYIDFGNKETLNLDRFTEMPKHYRQFPPISVRIVLADVDMTDAVCNIIQNQEIDWQMSVVYPRSHPVEVTLSTSTGTFLKDMLPKTVPANGGRPQLRSESRTEDKFGGSNKELKVESEPKSYRVNQSDAGVKAPSVKSSGSTCSLNSLTGRVEKLEISEFRYDDADIVKLPVGKTVDVTFITVTAPLAIHCWYGNSNAIEKRLNDLTNRITEVMKSDKRASYSPKEGDLCVARYSVDRKWYRAAIIKEGEIVCRVTFVDFGNHEMLRVTDIGPMRKEFMDFPIQGVYCVIKGIPDNVNFGPDKCKAFKELVPVNQMCKVEVVDFFQNMYNTIRIPSIEPALKKLQMLDGEY